MFVFFLFKERVTQVTCKGAMCGFWVHANWVNLGLSQRTYGVGRNIWSGRGYTS